MECRWWLGRRDWPRWLAAVGVAVAALLVVWAGTGAAAEPCPAADDTASGEPGTGAASTAAAPTGGACPAGYTCIPAHAQRDGKRVDGIFVVLDEPTSSATTTTTPAASRTAASTTVAPTRSRTAAAPPRASTRPPAARTSTRTTTTTRAPMAAELPGAVDVDAAQRRAEACDAGYGCPVPSPGRVVGVVPAPGCTAADARPPDGRC